VTPITTPLGWPDFAQLPPANTHIYMIDEGGMEEGHCIPVPGYVSDQRTPEWLLHQQVALRWAWDCSRLAEYRGWWVAIWSGNTQPEGPWPVGAFMSGENVLGRFLMNSYGGGWNSEEMAWMHGPDSQEEYHRLCKLAGVPVEIA
jgi:hypothetical protein